MLAIALLALTLYQQTVKGLIEQRFAATEHLLLNAANGEVIASNWTDPERAAPVGSLVKPLLLAAYGGTPPLFECDGRACWRPDGHGRIGGTRALAESCNEYFEALAKQLPRDRLESFAARYRLGPPVNNGSAIGRGTDWLLSPLQLLQAYRELAGHGMVRAGMLRAAGSGTAQSLKGGVLAKTGTSACSHPDKAEGDGYVVVLLPVEKPEWALLVRVHGTTGARAAAHAAEIVRTIREGK